MSSSPDQPLDDSFGAWVLEDLSEDYYIERNGWAPERAERVADRLQRDRPPEERLRVVVFFGSKETAFTVQGPYLFLSRRLLERCRTDAACAWILAHEIAHHDLDHVARVPDWMVRYVRHRGAWVLAALAQVAAHRILGPEREAEADRHAVDLCLRAGYHPVDFLGAFDAIETLVRDIGNEDAIYGPDFALLDELDGRSSLLGRLRVWQWERSYGYYPFRERRRRVEAYLDTLTWRTLGLERETVQPDDVPDGVPDPWKLPPAERGLFTSLPSVPPGEALQPTLRIGSLCWKCGLAPREQVILIRVDDDANRMLARLTRRFGEDFAERVAVAVPGVFRRWWRGHDGEFYMVQVEGGTAAVVARLPHGPWRPDITELTCLRPDKGGRRILPWYNLGYASVAELEAMRTGDAVAVAKQDVEVLDEPLEPDDG
jgi:hypothetical protein